MVCWAAYERVRRGSRGAAKTAGRLWAAVREDGAAVREDGAAVRHRHRLPPGKVPTDSPLAEPPRSQRYMSPPAGRSGSVDASSATRTEASGRKALAKLKLSKAGKRGETMRS